LEADSAAAAQSDKRLALETSSQSIPSQADQLVQFFSDSELLRDAEAAIRSDLERRGIMSPIERERVLVRLFSVAGISALFERTYNLIFGSQVLAPTFKTRKSWSRTMPTRKRHIPISIPATHSRIGFNSSFLIR
jgi:hypothetical protein